MTIKRCDICGRVFEKNKTKFKWKLHISYDRTLSTESDICDECNNSLNDWIISRTNNTDIDSEIDAISDEDIRSKYRYTMCRTYKTCSEGCPLCYGCHFSLMNTERAFLTNTEQATVIRSWLKAHHTEYLKRTEYLKMREEIANARS